MNDFGNDQIAFRRALSGTQRAWHLVISGVMALTMAVGLLPSNAVAAQSGTPQSDAGPNDVGLEPPPSPASQAVKPAATGGAAKSSRYSSLATAQSVTITGTPVVGSPLTATGSWIGAASDGVEEEYLWRADGRQVGVGASFTVKQGLEGKTLTVTYRVTDLASGWESEATASILVEIPSLISPVPTIVGTAALGKVLNVNTTGWTSGTVLAYQWYAGGAAIRGANSSTFKLTVAQVGKTMTVTVTGTRTGYESVAKTSGATSKVAAGKLSTATPKITGTAKVGKKLTAKTGAWTSGTKPSFQWYAGGKKIKGATGRSLTVAASQRGKRITVKVTGTKAGYTTTARTSKKTHKVTAGTLTSTIPKIICRQNIFNPDGDLFTTGFANLNKKLIAKPGKWTKGTALKYQWYAGGKAIKGATKSTFTPRKAQTGKRITVKVTGTKAGYRSVSKTSKKTTKVEKYIPQSDKCIPGTQCFVYDDDGYRHHQIHPDSNGHYVDHFTFTIS